MIAMNNRVHIFALPAMKERLIDFFTNILECEVSEVPGTSILAFQFPDGGSLSVEFTDDALDEKQTGRAAWLEIRTDDSITLINRVVSAGLARVEYLGSDRFYFQAPGGQVWGILEVDG